MVETILCNIDEFIKSLYPNAKYWGIARKENNGEEQTVFRYKGWGDNEYVGFDDTHSMNAYHRILSAPETSDLNSGFGNKLMRRSVYNMRLVVFGNMRKINDTDKDINYTIAPNIASIIPNRINKAILDLIGVRTGVVQIRDKIFDRPRILSDEMQGVEYTLHPETLLFAIDYSITLDYTSDCVEYGCEPVIPKVTVIDGANTIELTAPETYTCSTECADATATATNSEDTNLGTITIESGGTGNIPISDSVISNTAGVLSNVPATEPYTVGNSLVTLTNTLGTVLSTNNLPATVALPLTAPNSTTNVQDQNGNPLGQTTGISGATNTQQVTIPVCPDLDELVDTSTSTEVYDAIVSANKECAIQASLVNRYGEGCLIGKAIIPTLPATNFPSPSGMYWFDNKMYFCSGNNLQIYDAITKDVITIVGGFNIPTRVAANASIIAVANFGTTQVRIMDANSPSTQLALYSVISQPVGTALSPDGSTLYVGSQNGSQIRKYNPLTGATIGSVITGNQTRVDQITMHAGGTEYWCITSNSGSTQQIIRRLISNDSVVGTITLLSVAAAGLARSFSIKDNGNVIVIYDLFKAIEYDTSGTEIRQTFTGGFACAGGIIRNQSEECEVHWAAAQNFSQITQWICPS